MIDKLNEWIRTRRAEIERERAPGTTYGDTGHDQTAVHFGQLELLDDLQHQVDKLEAVDKLQHQVDTLRAIDRRLSDKGANRTN